MKKDGASAEDADFCRECYEDSLNEVTSRPEDSSSQNELDHCCCCCGCCGSESEQEEQCLPQEKETAKDVKVFSEGSRWDQRGAGDPREQDNGEVSSLKQGGNHVGMYDKMMPVAVGSSYEHLQSAEEVESDSQCSACCEVCCQRSDEKENECADTAAMDVGEEKQPSVRGKRSKKASRKKHRRRRRNKRESSGMGSFVGASESGCDSCEEYDCCDQCCSEGFEERTSPKSFSNDRTTFRERPNNFEGDSISGSDSECSFCVVCARESFLTSRQDANRSGSSSRNVSARSQNSSSVDEEVSSYHGSVQDSGVDINEAPAANDNEECVLESLKQLRTSEGDVEYCEQCALGNGYSSEEQCECEQCQPQSYDSDNCEVCGFRGLKENDQNKDSDFLL